MAGLAIATSLSREPGPTDDPISKPVPVTGRMNYARKMTIIRLRDIAHARAGDKGNISNISLWVQDPADFPLVRDQITEEAVRKHFGEQVHGSVTRYGLPHLHGLNFVMTDALDGGVNGSLNLDGHGKSWSAILLDMTVDVPQ